MKKNSFVLNLISRIMILVLVLIMSVGTTFSWYDRTQRADDPANLIRYEVTGKVNNGTSATVETFVGTKEDGVVTYSETALPTSGVDSNVTTTSGEITYFKTVITDTSNYGDSLVSLYFTQFSCDLTMGNYFHIGIIGPEKTYNQYTGTSSGTNYVITPMLVEDNILLKNKSVVEVYWFLEVDAAYIGDGTVNLGVPYIVNN